MSRARYETVGYVAIDSGMIRLTDAGEAAAEVAGVLAHQVVNEYDVTTEVLVSTGRGDGLYPVLARIVDGRVASIMVTFLDE